MQDPVEDVIIVGAGAAGLMCALRLGEAGIRALVLEGQSRPARKLVITGGGRCNLTNVLACPNDYGTSSPRILKHVLKTVSPKDVMAFFRQQGISLVEEEGGKIFTADGRASRVAAELERAALSAGARILCGQKVEEAFFREDVFCIKAAGRKFRARRLVIATGGLSYPSTGSTGDGFRFAKAFGHKIRPTLPALAPLVTPDKSYASLAGISLPVRLVLFSGGKKTATSEGGFLFTHQGFSGPAVLDISRDWQKGGPQKRLLADFLPQISVDELEKRLMEKGARSGMVSLLGECLPKRLAVFIAGKAGIDPHQPAGLLRRDDRRRFLGQLKEHLLAVSVTAGFSRAEVTCGGVDMGELKGASLESRLQSGLFFAGEVLDVDGRVGGYNLQWAWASAAAVAQGVLRSGKW